MKIVTLCALFKPTIGFEYISFEVNETSSFAKETVFYAGCIFVGCHHQLPLERNMSRGTPGCKACSCLLMAFLIVIENIFINHVF
jgi:hypothetical protein